MDVGTAEIVETDAEFVQRKGGLTSSSPPGGGGSGKNPGGGGDRPDEAKIPDRQPFAPDKSRILTAFLLLVVLMTFGGLIAAYVVIATNNVPEWKPFDLPVPIWISTVLILLSSLAYHFGKRATDLDDQPIAKKWFVVTTVLGGSFISSQILAWLALTDRGLYLRANPYAGFFYVLTAVHAVHVLGGITALGAIVLRSWFPSRTDEERQRRRTLAQVVGWYWHLMGMLWLVLLVLLGFWK